MHYPAAKKYLLTLANYEKNINYSYRSAFKLKRFKKFLSLLGNPQRDLRIIHIAGTKGKGSTCVFIAYILRQAGFSCGLYTSPHLADFRERIRILKPLAYRHSAPGEDFEGMISRPAISRLVRKLKPAVEEYNRHLPQDALSFFEVYTALAFLYFQQEKTDFVVLETGLGGRLDATNLADSIVCGITPISFEHVDKLGNTLDKIAAEKAAIIKRPGAIVICASQAKAARQVIQKQCQKFQAKLYEVGRQIKYSVSPQGLQIRGLKNNYRNLRLKLLGEHQAANAALALGVVESLSARGFDIGALAIRRGLAQAVWPGRCEVIQKKPWIILDGAQNAASAQVLSKAIKENFLYRRLILVLGICADKDIPGVCRYLSRMADEVILTRANTTRAVAPGKLTAYFKPKPYLTQSVKEARILAAKLAAGKDLVLVTGSLFVVGEFRNGCK